MKATSKTAIPIKEEQKAAKPDDKDKGGKKQDAQDDKNKKGGKDAAKDKVPAKDDGKGQGLKPGKEVPGKDQGKGGKDDKGKKGKKEDDSDNDVEKKGGKDIKGKGGKNEKDDKSKVNKDDKTKGAKDDKGKKSKDDSDNEDDDKQKKGKARNGSIDDSRVGRSKDGKGDAKGNRSKTLGKKKVEEEEKKEVKKNINPYIQVTEFYLGQFKAPICGADINEMHSWKGQYPHLDINHAYFHWLFPHFQGTYGKERANMFKDNATIGKRIIESYKLILDFYGIQLDDEATGVTSRAENYLVRYKDTFLRPFTNHDFRIKRMLQFLNVTGFRIYAIELVKFFEREIFKIGKNSLPPLRTLELTYKIDWQIYGQIDEKDKKAVDQFNQKCLFPYEIVSKDQNAHLKTLS